MRWALTGATACLLAWPASLWSQASDRPDPLGVPGVGLVLEGVIMAASPESSLALVRRTDAERGRSVHVGEAVYGWTLIAVSEESAVLQRDGERIELYLDGRGSPVGERSRVGSSHGPSEEAFQGNEKDSERREGAAETWIVRRLDRAGTEERLKKEMPVILAETGLVVRAQGGETRGLRITHLPEGTLVSELGLLPGDVLLSINGVALDSLAALTGLYPNLQQEKEIRIVVERAGRIVKLAYDIH